MSTTLPWKIDVSTHERRAWIFAPHLRLSSRRDFIERVFKAAEVMLYQLEITSDEFGVNASWVPALSRKRKSCTKRPEFSS